MMSQAHPSTIKLELGLHFVTASKCLAHHQLEGIAVQQQLEVRLLAITQQDSANTLFVLF